MEYVYDGVVTKNYWSYRDQETNAKSCTVSFKKIPEIKLNNYFGGSAFDDETIIIKQDIPVGTKVKLTITTG